MCIEVIRGVFPVQAYACLDDFQRTVVHKAKTGENYEKVLFESFGNKKSYK